MRCQSRLGFIAVMKFIVKLFPEIIIKSKPVRKQFTRQLHSNLYSILKVVDPTAKVERSWDRFVVESSSTDQVVKMGLIDGLSNTPGIAYFLDVLEYPLGDLDDVLEKTLALYSERLTNKTFAVRCKRAGQHSFRSVDVERYVGGGLNQHTQALGVKLKEPDIEVALEIRDQALYVVSQRHSGLGGFPLGTLDPVLSLISGGFDSTVASYLTMKRGMRTHFCFFNLGGRDHQLGVKEIALYLWSKFGSSHKVKFVTVNFEEVVAEILREIENSQMGVILKRMMLRAASQIAKEMKVDALVTGESVAQVSSQTLRNLSVIDEVTNTLILRPLITSDKDDVIKVAREIGAEQFAANMPEYCGVISVKPTTRARLEKIEKEEACFDFSVLEQAVLNAKKVSIDELLNEEIASVDVEVLSIPLAESIIVDIRHPAEEDSSPLQLAGNKIEKMPFYEIHSRYCELDSSKTYMLYCGKGIMSRLHAAQLVEKGLQNIKVFQP